VATADCRIRVTDKPQASERLLVYRPLDRNCIGKVQSTKRLFVNHVAAPVVLLFSCGRTGKFLFEISSVERKKEGRRRNMSSRMLFFLSD